MAATARLEGASGLDSSAEENCLNRRSRDSLSSSATAVRTWCCTAVVDSAPKWRGSTFVTCPWSGPKASSRCVRSSVTTCSRRRGALDLARGLLDVGAQHLDAQPGLLAVQHPGADLDRVDHHARPGPRRRRIARAPARRPRVGRRRFSTIRRRRAGARGGRSGVAASMVSSRRLRRRPTERTRRPPAQRRRSRVRPSGSSSATSSRRPARGPGRRGRPRPAGDRLRRALEDRLDRPVGAVARPARDARALGLAAHPVAEEDALHAPVARTRGGRSWWVP